MITESTPHYLSPAEYVFLIFGGVKATARALGLSHGPVSRWKKASKRRQIGQIPSSVQRLILDIAKEKNLNITPNDLIYGRNLEPINR